MGDLITITNPEEGGWWEGTLGSRTGWFPSNYVVPVEDPIPLVTDKMKERNCSDEYKSVIVNELVESERAYIRDMDEFYESVLKNIGALVGGHGDPVVAQLQSSYSALVNAHKVHVLGPLGGGGGVRVGKLFMDAAVEIAAG